MQCDRTDGSCVCIPGIGGHRCGECARGYMEVEVIGRPLTCSPCGECFENWDRIIGDLKRMTQFIFWFPWVTSFRKKTTVSLFR